MNEAELKALFYRVSLLRFVDKKVLLESEVKLYHKITFRWEALYFVSTRALNMKEFHIPFDIDQDDNDNKTSSQILKLSLDMRESEEANLNLMTFNHFFNQELHELVFDYYYHKLLDFYKHSPETQQDIDTE